jgi:hypothetical protein
VEGGQAYINLAYTRVLLDRLKNGGSVEPHKILVEEVCSGNAAAMGADELEAAAVLQEGLLRVLEKKKTNKDAGTDDGTLSEIAVDRPVVPKIGAKVQTRAADGEEWSDVAVVVQVGEDENKGSLKIIGTTGSASHKMPHWAPMQPPLMRRAPKLTKAEATDRDSEGATDPRLRIFDIGKKKVDDYAGKAKLEAAKSVKVDLDVEARLSGFPWAGVHTTAKVEHLCPQGKGPDKEGYSLVLLNCFSGKKFDALRTDLNKNSYDRVSGLLYYLVGLTAPEGGGHRRPRRHRSRRRRS